MVFIQEGEEQAVSSLWSSPDSDVRYITCLCIYFFPHREFFCLADCLAQEQRRSLYEKTMHSSIELSLARYYLRYNTIKAMLYVFCITIEVCLLRCRLHFYPKFFPLHVEKTTVLPTLKAATNFRE